MNYPRLFVGGSFNRIITPVQVSITENIIPLSTATITLPKGERLPSRSYVELFTPYGSAGMYRVRQPRNSYGSETNTAELEHMVSVVGDWIVKEKIEEMLPANTAMTRVFSHYKGQWWKLGSVSALGSGKVAVDCDHDRILDVMLSILEQKPDCMMSFNFSTTPWTINIVKKGTTVTGEGRLSRNVKTATVSYDDSELVTRVWYRTFTKKGNDVQEQWNYKDASTLSSYGTVERTVSTDVNMTAEEINNVVNTYIEEHKEPRVNVSIQATELSRITGESMDKFTLGKRFRLAIPDYSFTLEDNITSITWNDPYNDPMDVTVTLGDDEDTVVTYLHNLDAKGSGGGGGGGGAKKEEEEKWKEYFTTFERTDEYIRQTANHVDRNGKILEQAGMKLNSQGMIIYANDNKNNIGAKLTVLNDQINLRVRADGIINAINVSKEGVVIQGKRIDINGIVTKLDVNFFKGRIAQIGAVTMNNVTVNGGLTCFGRVTGNVLSGMSMELGGASFSNVLVSASVSGNTLTLTPLTGSPVTFSKATTLTGSWSGGTFLVSASPQGNTVQTTITGGTAYRDSSILCIPVNSDFGYTGKEVYAALTQRTNCVSGLTRYGSATLYVQVATNVYQSVGNHVWYYRGSNASLSTWYTFDG